MSAAIDDDAPWLVAAHAMPHGKLWIVANHGIRANHDRINTTPQFVRFASRRLARNPLRVSGPCGDFTVQAHRGLRGHERHTCHDPPIESLIHHRRFFGQQPRLNPNPCAAQYLQPTSIMFWVWIERRDDHALHARRDDRVRARRRLPPRATRLHRHVQRRPSRVHAAQCKDLRVCPTRASVPALADDATVAYEHRTNRRIRARLSQPTSRQCQRPPHKPLVLLAERHDANSTSLSF
jgi:hypothetical protein